MVPTTSSPHFRRLALLLTVASFLLWLGLIAFVHLSACSYGNDAADQMPAACQNCIVPLGASADIPVSIPPDAPCCKTACDSIQRNTAPIM